MMSSDSVLWPLLQDGTAGDDDAVIAEALERGLLPSLLAFGAQRDAVECNARFVALVCSGRAGKTRGFLLKWLQVCARKPGQVSVYVAMTLRSARRIAWWQIKELDAELGLELEYNESELRITHPNGSSLILLGANRDDLVDVLRGFPIVLIGFDEAAFFRSGLLKRAIDDAVLVRLMDYGGECWLMSTPGYVCSGYHYDAITGKEPGYRVFHWNITDNPHMPKVLRPGMTRDESLEADRLEMLQLKSWTEQTPSYMRDWLGEYVDDPDARVYRFSRTRSLVADMPDSWRTHRAAWTTILGIDYGSTNAFAMVLWAWEKGSRCVYGVRAQKWYGRAPSECADLTRKWRDEYGVDRIVGDSAAKGYIDEARVRHQLPIGPADKLNKRGHIEHMNDNWLAGRIVLVGTLEYAEGADVTDPYAATIAGPCAEYADELEKLGWDARFEKGHPSYRMKEDPNAENDACDAGLYGWCESPAFAEQPLPPPPPPNPAVNTAFEAMYAERIRQVKPTHPGLRGAFGAARFLRRR